MSCGGRIYKGDTVYVSVPFDVEGYSALTISFFTNGEYKITRTEEEVTIEDGFITAVFEGHDLDVLPDGVLRYTIECEVEGEEYVDSSNTMFYLKTPKDYDAADVQDYYNSGYTEGYASGLTQGFPDGYESGHTDGYNEAYPIAWNSGHESGYTEGRARGWQDGVSWEQEQIAQQAISLSFSANGEWQKDFFDDIYANRVVVNVPIDEIYQSGYTAGVADGFESGHTALDISGFEVGLGFYGPARVSFRNYDSDYPMHRYLIDMINPETGEIINIDSDFDGITWSFSGDGYHMIWMTPMRDIPSGVEWVAISSYSGDHVNIVLTDSDYEVGNFMRTEVNISYLYYDGSADAHHLVKYLMKF